MTPTIHLISDLHLCESQPHLLNLFEHYMNNIASNSQQLYVLGDLFEVWVGDDNGSPLNQKVIDLFKHYSHQSGQLYFAHGNRDFLLGQAFANATGATLIEEPHHCVWDNKKISLIHGDSLCTDDIAYQQFKAMVRNPIWQQEFLSQSLEKRLAYAVNVRQQSKNEQVKKDHQIMDVNQQAVKQFFLEHNCQWLIHGHTHREGQHQIKLNDNQQGERIVLSDWQTKGHYLEYKNNQINSVYFEI